MGKQEKNFVIIEGKEFEVKKNNETIKKHFNFEPKSLNEETREFKFYGSTEQIDRHGDIVLKSAFDIQKINSSPIPLRYLHSTPIGKILWGKYDDYGLLCAGMIDKGYPDADKAFMQVQQGSLPFTSIGFCNGEYYIDETKAPNRIWKSIDLGEISLVDVPSNPGAIIKSFDFEKIQKAYETETDIEFKGIYENIIQNKKMIDDLEGFKKELEELKLKNAEIENQYSELGTEIQNMKTKSADETKAKINSEFEKLKKLLKK